jgi:gamma-glutamyl:cysteine ligase YbdK (ATP-grasp superfamily)
MGLDIDRIEFDDEDRRRFSDRLARSLEVLAELVDRPGFGEGAPSLGAELEVSLVGEDGRPLLRNTEVLKGSVDPRLTVELDRFNLEANLRHGPLAGRSLSGLVAECQDCLSEIQQAAAPHGAHAAMIGILPTLTRDDLERDAMTDFLRYAALSRSLRRLRDEPFLLDIHADDDLNLECSDVTYEGAATSFQVHLRVAPRDFADVYDAIQLSTPAVLALAGNSPTFLGRRLWHETRIALFKQAVDHRPERGSGGRPARVSFGSHWTSGPLELFREPVEGHVPLLPVLDVEDPDDAFSRGGTPSLRELRLHQGTVWRWNRAIYDPAEGGHLRVEMRALPSGPTVTDMVANAAFHLGLALDVAAAPGDWREELAFECAEADFYRAAREGLDTTIHWPAELGGPGHACGIRELMPDLLSRAQRGLSNAGVDDSEVRDLLDVIDRRVRGGQTGALWQRKVLARAEETRPRREAIELMFRAYLDRSREGEPVDRWSLPR